MKNRLIKIFIGFFEAVLLYVIFNYSIGCFFRNNFSIRCPGCGLTRALVSIINLNFISAFKYNIMSIPLFIIVFLLNVLLLYDIIFNKNKSQYFIVKLSRYYIFIFILMIVTTVINNVNKI